MMSRPSTPTPKATSHLATWFQRLFASLKRLLGRTASQPDATLDESAPQQAGRQTLGAIANDVRLASWEQPNPQARLAPEWRNTGAFELSDRTPPYTPRSLAAHISRPLDASHGYPGLPARQDLSSAPTPPFLPGFPRKPHTQDDDTLPPDELQPLYPLNDPDAPTLPRLDLSQPPLPMPNEFFGEEGSLLPALPPVTPPEERSLNPIDVSPLASPSYESDNDDIFDEEGEDAAQHDERMLAEATAGSPIARRRLLFLRYLVRRSVYNEGFSAHQAPQQYHRSLGFDDDTVIDDDTLPGL